MKIKKILRFYFSADSLERAFNNLIFKNACNSAYSGTGDLYADRICNLIGEKQELSGLWKYLDGVMGGFTDGERETLAYYAAMRCGVKRLCEEKRKEVKRVAIKFSRRARGLGRYERAAGLVGKYYCLLT